MSGGWITGMTQGAAAIPTRRVPGGNPNGDTPGLSDFHQRGIDAANSQGGPSDFESAVDSGIGFYNSDAVQNTLMVAPLATAAAYGGITAAMGGATGGAIFTGAMTAAAPVAATIAVAVVAGYVGMRVGEVVGEWAMEKMGYERISEDGEMPATVGHDIAHTSSWSWGALVLGAIAAVAVVATFGTALVVIAAAAAIGGLAIGFASVAGQYGTNKGKIKTGSPNVFFHNKPVARVTDIVDCSDHAKSFVAEGAETVFANNWPIARIGHKTTCDGTINDGIPDIAIDIDTSAIRLKVDVGWGSRAGDIAQIVADILPIGGRKPRPGKPTHGNGGKPPNSCRTGAGCPVDVATGEYMEARTDLFIPATIPLRLDRCHAPEARGIQGKSWAGTWAQHLRIDGQIITFQNTDGSLISFEADGDEVLAYNMMFPHLELMGRLSADLFVYDRRSRLILVFADEHKDTRRLARIEDLNGNRITFRYGMDGLRRVDHSDGFSLRVHSEGGLIRHAALDSADGEDCVFTWGYDRAGKLAEVRSSQTGFQAYKYDTMGRIVGWHDGKETRVHYEYGPEGRIIRSWSDSGHVGIALDYDIARKRTITRTDDGATAIWDWTDEGYVWRTTDALGHVWTTEWDDAYHITARINPLGIRTEFEFDSYGNMVSATDGAGAKNTWEFNHLSLMVSSTDPSGARTEYRYDDRANLVGVTDAMGNVTTVGHGSKGEVLRIDHPDQAQERIYYDPLLRPSRRRDPDGNETRMGHDTEGRLRWFTDEVGSTRRYDLTRGPENPLGALRQVETEDLAISTVAWDSAGQLASITDPAGGTRYFRFGAFNIPTETVDPQGHRLRLEHDRQLRLTAVINEVGERYEMFYDGTSRLVAEKDYSGQVTKYVYDAAGRMSEKVSPNGTRNRFEYTPTGLLSRSWVEDGELGTETTYEYDVSGRLIRATNTVATVEYDYDALGRIIAERLNGREITSEYSVSGQRIARAGDVLHLKAGWTRAGLPAELRIGDHAPMTFRHDPRGLEQLRQSSTGFALAQGYTPMGRLSEQIAGPVSHLPPEAQAGGLGGFMVYEMRGARTGIGMHRLYEWDRVGRPISIEDAANAQTRFDYDRRGQVTTARRDTRASGAVLSHFEYDPAGNIAAIVEQGHVQPVTKSAGRVKRRGHVTYRHDSCGRVIEKRVEEQGFRPKVWRMAWNGLDQLVAVETPTRELWHYAYDAFGRRVARIAEGKGGFAYLWEGDYLIAEAPMTADGTVSWQAARHWVYEAGSLVPIAQVEAGEVYYVVTDHMGTPKELFCEDGSEVVWRASTNLWGESRQPRAVGQAANDNTPRVNCPIRFQGQWYDEESGLHYNRFRYYDPEATQYLSPDPIGLDGGMRPQAYVSDPNTNADPLGLNPLTPGDFGAGTIMDDPALHRMWIDAMKSAASSSRSNGYTRYLKILESGKQPTLRQLERAFGAVNQRFQKAARAAGYTVAETHHWNYDKMTYADQIVDPRHLVPTESRDQHTDMHRQTTSSSNIWKGPIDPQHRIDIPDVSTPLPDNYFNKCP